MPEWFWEKQGNAWLWIQITQKRLSDLMIPLCQRHHHYGKAA